ncbi:PREDICTED: putative B3 domain-containing protein At5g35780 [Camelina sativa]|uniref:B3 domain-containing protein At5g35780 n=1 Tax=Camelina sativa TaxID=90675 RepID=A0ABM0U6R4_CAMSA|nr:PREDICTED: putative B3 domain-containing protein At5g35780 [Camelina sativa]
MSMNHLTVTDSGKDMWSNLFLLVDTAVMVREEEQRRRRGEDDSEKSFFYLFPRKKRSSLVKRRYAQQNPNGTLMMSSASSSFVNLRCYNYPSLLLGYNTAKSAKTETNDPSYEPCLKENTTSRKRRAVQQRKSGNFKKAKVATFPRRTDTETPEWIFQVMRRMRADAANPLLIFEKGLKASDVKSGQSRLLIPFQQLIRNDFLTPGEHRAIDKDDENIGVGAIFVNQRCEKWGVRFKIWAMEKDSGHGTLNYALNWGWNDVVKGNHLKQDDKISLWTFRCRGVLCFALETY